MLGMTSNNIIYRCYRHDSQTVSVVWPLVDGEIGTVFSAPATVTRLARYDRENTLNMNQLILSDERARYYNTEFTSWSAKKPFRLV